MTTRGPQIKNKSWSFMKKSGQIRGTVSYNSYKLLLAINNVSKIKPKKVK